MLDNIVISIKKIFVSVFLSLKPCLFLAFRFEKVASAASLEALLREVDFDSLKQCTLVGIAMVIR